MTTIVPADLTQFLSAAKALPEHPALSEAIGKAEEMITSPSEQTRMELRAMAFRTMGISHASAFTAMYGRYSETVQAANMAAFYSTAALAWMAAALETP